MAFNTTDFDYEATLGLSPKQIVVTGLLLTGLKVSASFVLHNQQISGRSFDAFRIATVINL